MSSWVIAIQQDLNLDQEQLIVCRMAAHAPVPAVCSTSYCSSPVCHSIHYQQINTLAWRFCSNYHQWKGNIFKLLSVVILLIHGDELQTPCRSLCVVQAYGGIRAQIYISLTCLKFSFLPALASDYFNAFINSGIRLHENIYENQCGWMIRLYM